MAQPQSNSTSLFLRAKHLLYISLFSISQISYCADIQTEPQQGYEYYQDELVSDDDFYIDEYSANRVFFTLEGLLGGNTLETITFDNGETDSIRAGSGAYLALGIAHLIFDRQMDIGIKGGILLDEVTAENDLGDKSTLSFTRYPIDLFSHLWLGRHIIGGGVSYHINPTFKSDANDHSTSYENTLGVYAEYLYHFVNTGTALGVKYISINYKNDQTGKETDGSAVGITFSQMF